MAVYLDFAPRLGELKKDLEWLAREAGLSPVQLRRHQERKAKYLTFELLERTCRALGCQPADVLRRDER